MPVDVIPACGHEDVPPIKVGDELDVYHWGRRRVVAVGERYPVRRGQSVCVEVFPRDNVWGGWVWVPDDPYAPGVGVRRLDCPQTGLT